MRITRLGVSFLMCLVLMLSFLAPAAAGELEGERAARLAFEELAARTAEDDPTLDLVGRLKALDMPPDRAEKISTADLVELCLAHPFMIIIPAYSDPLDGLRVLADNFTGLAELLARPDVGKRVLERLAQPGEMSVTALDFLEAILISLPDSEYVPKHFSVS